MDCSLGCHYWIHWWWWWIEWIVKYRDPCNLLWNFSEIPKVINQFETSLNWTLIKFIAWNPVIYFEIFPKSKIANSNFRHKWITTILAICFEIFWICKFEIENRKLTKFEIRTSPFTRIPAIYFEIISIKNFK